jgi:ABC-type multidrug transport system fused ATPase/permease subunit
VFRYSGRAVSLVWSTNRRLTIALAVLSVCAGLLPGAIAFIGKLIIDTVLEAASPAHAKSKNDVLALVASEMALVTALLLVNRGLSAVRSLLRVILGHRVNQMVLEKALTLELVQFEDSELYDKMTRARREASSRPLSLVMRTFGLCQDLVSLVTYGALLVSFSGWAVLILAVAALPTFVGEARYSGEAFRLFRFRTPETREQNYLEMVIAREDYAKEVQLFALGRRLLERYNAIFERVFAEDRDLTIRRNVGGFALGLLSTLAFYGAYAWMALSAVAGRIGLGAMTMYVMVFRQGQSAFSSLLTAISGMYEDNLYLGTLFEFLEEPTRPSMGTCTVGEEPSAGLRFDDVSFTYPGAERPALSHVNLTIRPGEKLAVVGENGSGKTTLIKLLTRLYLPTEGRILLDGTDLNDWDPRVLRERIGVIFQDFARYQFSVGENVGVGDVHAIEDRTRWRDAAEKGLSAPFIEALPEQYDTQLGKWFKNGRELSLGQWQKIALSRAFMRKNADIVVLDEPTASMDAQAEMQIFERFRRLTEDQMALLISHRFSTVRMADQIVVIEAGRIVERGSHDELVTLDGRYARLFSLQAAGYR